MSPPSVLPLSEFLPQRDFELKMRFTKGDIASFYQSRHSDPRLLAERRHGIAQAPEKYTALVAEGEALLEETIDLALAHETIDAPCLDGPTPLARCQKLAELWEADFLLMKPDKDGTFRLRGGAVCFPSHWGLQEKMGRSMTEIHAPVPGLNETLGRQINGFLQRIKPGISWERGNWGLSRSPEFNLHPSLARPRLDASIDLADVWWRLEEQSLVALPHSQGILFGIKLVIRPLADLKADPPARAGLVRALETMSGAMAEYKGLQSARNRLLTLLSE